MPHARIPLPYVNFARIVYLIFIISSILLQNIYILSSLSILLLLSLIVGNRLNLIGYIGRKAVRFDLESVKYEDTKAIHFNNYLLIAMLIISQVAYLGGYLKISLSFAILAIAAIILALSGYCIGCVIYYKYKIYQYKIFKSV